MSSLECCFLVSGLCFFPSSRYTESRRQARVLVSDLVFPSGQRWEVYLSGEVIHAGDNTCGEGDLILPQDHDVVGVKDPHR